MSASWVQASSTAGRRCGGQTGKKGVLDPPPLPLRWPSPLPWARPSLWLPVLCVLPSSVWLTASSRSQRGGEGRRGYQPHEGRALLVGRLSEGSLGG